MPSTDTVEDEKYEGFDIWKIRGAADSFKSLQEIKDKPEMLKAVQKYLKEEQDEAGKAANLIDNI